MTREYQCHNRPPFKPSYIAQDGYKEAFDQYMTPIRVRNDVEVQHVNSTNCRYTAWQSDPGCSECEHGGKDE
jgi:hypothetical protein